MVQGKRPAGARVCVYDAEGYQVAAGIAEQLASEGLQVELLTPFDVLSPACDETLEGPLLRRRVHEAGVAVRRNVTVTGVEQGRIAAEDEFGNPLELATNAIVIVTQRVSDDALYRELIADEELLRAEGIEGVYRIGDCISPRHTADAVFDGHRLAREIDSENPALPLPHRRELPSPARAAEILGSRGG
jgi:dimethylamine/trimethylamine dehydrogenase